MPKRKKASAQPARPRKRRPRGSGSSWQEADGGWRGKAYLGRDPGTGKPLYRWVRADSRAEVERLMRAAAPPDPDSVTVAQWAATWLAGIKVRPASARIYRVHLEQRILPALGPTALNQLTAWQIEAAAGKWAGSPATVGGTLAVLATCLQAAVKARLIAANPARAADRPVAGEKKFHLFTRPELRAIFAAALADPRYHFAAVMAATGLRCGEAVALEPGDHDPAAGTLAVRRTWTPFGVGPPKSRRSARTIAVPPEVAPALADPARLSSYAARRRFAALLRQLGLSHRGTHQLRHSFASYALADGFPVADLAAHLGHTPAELLRTYGHPTGASIQPTVRRLLGL